MASQLSSKTVSACKYRWLPRGSQPPKVLSLLFCRGQDGLCGVSRKAGHSHRRLELCQACLPQDPPTLQHLTRLREQECLHKRNVSTCLWVSGRLLFIHSFNKHCRRVGTAPGRGAGNISVNLILKTPYL